MSETDTNVDTGAAPGGESAGFDENSDWAVPVAASEHAKAANAFVMAEEEVVGEIADRYRADDKQGLNFDESDALDEMPAAIDRRSPSEKYAADAPDSEQAPDQAQAQQTTKSADQAPGDERAQLYHEALTQVCAGDEYTDSQVDKKMDVYLYDDLNRSHTSEQIRAEIGNAVRMYAVTNPDFQDKVTAAQYLFADDKAREYESQGHSPQVAMKAAADYSERMVLKAASDAMVKGADLAKHLDNIATNYLKNRPASAGDNAKTVQAGQKAFRGAGTRKGGKSIDEKIYEIKDAAEHQRLYREYEDSVAGHSSDWMPR